MKYGTRYESKTSRGEKVIVENHLLSSKAEARGYRAMLRERYECDVEMSIQPNIGFDCNTGREYSSNGLDCTFYIFPNRTLVKGM